MSASGATSSASCSSCRAGTYSGAAASACENCPAGQYQAGTGSTSCVLCSAGQGQSAFGSTACSAAPAHAWDFRGCSDVIATVDAYSTSLMATAVNGATCTSIGNSRVLLSCGLRDILSLLPQVCTLTAITTTLL